MVLMPGFQSTRLVTEGALEPFFFLYTDDSIQGNPETCKQSSIMLNYEVKNSLLPFERSAFMQKTDRTETTKNTTSRDAVKNTKIKDSGAKLIFRDPVLCAQLFLTS